MTSPTKSTDDKSIPSKDETPVFCKRIDPSEMDANSRLQTQKELVQIGQLMEKSTDVPALSRIKTMSLDNLTEYVEKKLSKDHYSPEVIYLLFQIQSLLLEKENLNNTLNIYTTTISDLKKELVIEKTLSCDLKDSIRESITELEEVESEKKKELSNHQTEYRILTSKHDNISTRKILYEKVITYLIPSQVIIISIIFNYIINALTLVHRFFS